jgi:hypothetical protein
MRDVMGNAFENGQFEEHPLVRMTDDAGNPETSRVLLLGFLGKGDRDDLVRLYLDVGLSSYIEFESAAILEVKNPEDHALHEPSEVWVRPSTPLTVIETSRRSIQAGFLQGGMADRMMALTGQRPSAHLFYGARGIYGSWIPPSEGGATCGATCMSV